MQRVRIETIFRMLKAFETIKSRMIMLTIYNDRIERTYYGESGKETMVLDKNRDDLFMYLSEHVQLADGLKFQNLLEHFINDGNSELLSAVVTASCGYTTSSFFQEIASILYLDKKEKSYEDMIEYLVLSPNTITLKKHKGIEDEHLSRWDFYGWGVQEEPYEGYYAKNNIETPQYGGYAIEFTPVNELRDYEIKLDDKMKIYDDEYTLIGGVKSYLTLFDLISSIVYELTFVGIVHPDEKPEALLRIEAALEEIDTGKYSTFDSFEEFKNAVMNTCDDECEDDECECCDCDECVKLNLKCEFCQDCCDEDDDECCGNSCDCELK